MLQAQIHFDDLGRQRKVLGRFEEHAHSRRPLSSYDDNWGLGGISGVQDMIDDVWADSSGTLKIITDIRVSVCMIYIQ
jgi:hypothetical protein